MIFLKVIDGFEEQVWGSFLISIFDKNYFATAFNTFSSI